MSTPFGTDMNQKLRKEHQIYKITKVGKAESLCFTILCTAVIILGCLPYSLYGQGIFNTAGVRRNNDGAAEDLARASTSQTSADQITGKIPWQYFSPSDQAQMRSIISNHTLYRRLPIAGGYCNPEILDFVLCHPETIVGLWETLGYTDLTLQQVGNSNYLLRDNAGTVGNVNVIFHSDEMLIIWCNGSYRGPVKSGEIVGEMLIVLQVRYTEDVQRKPVAICRMDSFVRVKNVGIDLMGRIFGPALGKIADNNLEQTFVFVSSISKTAEEEPDTLRDLVLRTSSLSPQTRENFLLMAQRAYSQSQALAQGQAVHYQLLPKMGQAHGNYARIIKRNPNEVPATSTAGVRAWRGDNVPEHWQVGRAMTPPRNEATLPESDAVSNHSARAAFGPIIPELKYTKAQEKQRFSTNAIRTEPQAVQTAPKVAPPLADVPSAKSLQETTRKEVARPVAKIPSPSLLLPENETVVAKQTMPDTAPAKPESQTAVTPELEEKQTTNNPLLTLPRLSKTSSPLPAPEEKKSGPRTEIVPEDTWRSVPSDK